MELFKWAAILLFDALHGLEPTGWAWCRNPGEHSLNCSSDLIWPHSCKLPIMREILMKSGLSQWNKIFFKVWFCSCISYATRPLPSSVFTRKHLSNTEFQGHFSPQCNEGRVLGLWTWRDRDVPEVELFSLFCHYHSVGMGELSVITLEKQDVQAQVQLFLWIGQTTGEKQRCTDKLPMGYYSDLSHGAVEWIN